VKRETESYRTSLNFIVDLPGSQSGLGLQSAGLKNTGLQDGKFEALEFHRSFPKRGFPGSGLHDKTVGAPGLQGPLFGSLIID